MIQSPKSQVAFLFFSTCLALFALLCIVNFTNPNEAGLLTFIFFYLSLFLLILGVFSVLGLIFRQWLIPHLYIINLQNSFRQAFFIAILVTTSFILQANHLLYWWVESSLILFLVFIEIFLNLKI